MIKKNVVKIKFDLKDNNQLDEVKIRLYNQQKEKILYSKKLTSNFEQLDLSFELSNNEITNASLEIKVFDNSIYSNKAEKIIYLKSDVVKPFMKVISTQHNAVTNGSQLVLFTLKEDDIKTLGVKVNNELFKKLFRLIKL